MPNPFPGMNPYLEAEFLWPDVHNRYIVRLADTLNELLPPQYVTRVESRLGIELQDNRFVPDITLLHRPVNTQQASGAATVLETDPPIVISALPDDNAQDYYIEVLAVREANRIVMTIELLSPANKTPGRGHELYRRKQRELLHSAVHLLELDFLREGVHTVAAPREALYSRAGHWDYAVCLHRGGDPVTEFSVWPCTVRQRLPRVRLPLDPGVADINVDLQDVLNRTYQAAGYDRSIQYGDNPTPALYDEDADWLYTLLREAGLRD